MNWQVVMMGIMLHAAAPAGGQQASVPEQLAVCESVAGGSTTHEKREITLDAVRSCLEHDPDNPRLHVALGNLLLVGNELDKAQQAYQHALQLDARSSLAMSGMANVLTRQGKFGEAEKMLLLLLESSPRPSKYYYELGCLYEQQGKQDKALQMFKEGVSAYEKAHKR